MASTYRKRTLSKGKASVGDARNADFKYKGFSSKEATKSYKLYDIELIKQDILNHFYIRKGEKLENPNFGTIICDMLLENFTQDVKDTIAKDVEEIINYDPRISVDSVAVDSTEQGIRIEAVITYLPYNLKERMKFDFDSATSRIS